MPLLNKLRQYIRPSRRKESEPAAAYDIWALNYDNQPDNLMLALDREVGGHLFDSVEMKNRTIADIGCGTGRHWKNILDRHPARLLGYDVSEGMLSILRQKHPGVETYILEDNRLRGLPDNTCDLVIS